MEYYNNDFDEGISIYQLITNILRHKFLVFFIVILFILSAVGYLKIAKYEYKSSVTLLVEPIKTSSTIGSVLSSDFFNSSDDISTEIQLITNVTNLEAALYELDLTNYKNEDGILYSALPIKNSIRNMVSVSVIKDTNLVEVSVVDTNRFFAADYANALAKSFNKMLSDFSRDSKNVQIEFLKQQIPETEQKIKEASDKLFDYKAKTKIDYITNNASTLVNNISYLKMRKKALDLQYDKNLKTLEDYQKIFNNHLLNIEQLQNDPYIKNLLKKYENSYNEIILFDLASNVNSWNTTNLSVVNSTINIGVNERISELNGLISETKTSLIHHIDFLNSEQLGQADLISNNIISYNRYIYIMMELLTCELDILSIDNEIANFENEFNQLPIITKELSKLQSDVNSLESIRDELNSFLEQVSLSAAAIENNVKLVSPALVSKSPISPNRLLILAVSLLLGIAFAILLALVIEMFDDVIHSLSDLKNFINKELILIGWVPLITINKKKNKDNLNKIQLINKYPSSYIAEKYKQVASNLIYGKNEKKQIFAITSSTISEGKSFFCANIALSLAKNGFKVLIIDADIKSPAISQYFNIKKNNSGYIKLIQENGDLQEALITPFKNISSLKIVSPGNSELVPSVFYKNTFFDDKFENLKKSFDYIFIDQPPIEFASDSFAYLDYIDSIIICSRLGVTTKKNLLNTIDLLQNYKNKIEGVVATACSVESVKEYSNTYNSYYKNYGYKNNCRLNNDDCFIFVKKEKQAKKIFKESIRKRNKK